MLAVALAFGSSLCWGVADFAGGLLSRRLAIVAVLALEQLSAIALAAILIVTAPGPAPGARAVALAGIAGVVGCAALAAFYRGLAIGTMSIVAPISAAGAAVPVIVGVARGERPGALQLAGIAVVMVGIVLAAREEGGGAAAGDGTRAVVLALVAALGFGTFFVLVAAAADRASAPWVTLIVRVGELALLLVAAALVRPPLPRRPADLAAVAVVGMLDAGANALYAAATAEGLLSVVAVVGSLYPAVTVVLARTVLRERISRPQQAGVVATLAGVVAISAG